MKNLVKTLRIILTPIHDMLMDLYFTFTALPLVNFRVTDDIGSGSLKNRI